MVQSVILMFPASVPSAAAPMPEAEEPAGMFKDISRSVMVSVPFAGCAAVPPTAASPTPGVNVMAPWAVLVPFSCTSELPGTRIFFPVRVDACPL